MIVGLDFSEDVVVSDQKMVDGSRGSHPRDVYHKSPCSLLMSSVRYRMSSA